MSGTIEGGRKAAATNKKEHGEDFYKRIGQIGGRNGHTGGFAADPERARRAGAKGGRKSRRGPSVNGNNIRTILEANAAEVMEMRRLGANCGKIAREFRLPYKTVYLWVRKKEKDYENE